MLGKLLKYDLKALSRILVPVHIAVIAVGVMGTAAAFLGFLLDAFDDGFGGLLGAMDDAVSLVSMLATFMLLLCVFLLFCATVATFVVVVMRFYKNLFTDEGYLTLTLPATAGQIVASKVLAGIIWMVVDAVVVLACLSVMCVAAEGFDISFRPSDFLPFWVVGMASGGFVDLFRADMTLGLILVWSARMVLSMLVMLLMAYLSFTLGASAATSHKVAASLGIFVGMWWVWNTITGTLGIFLGVMIPYSDWSAAAFSLLTVLLQCVVTAGCWALCTFTLARKVNLT